MNSTASGNSTTSGSPYGRPDHLTAGPILIQGFLQYLCQGVIISQTLKFYRRWQDDPISLRVYVVAVLVLSILQTVLESYKTWIATIIGKHWWTSNFHNAEFFLNSVICTTCEVFLVRRCYRITQRNVLVLIYLCALLVVAMVASVILTVRIAQFIGPSSQQGTADPLHASIYAYPLWVYATLATALSLTTILSVSLWRTRTGLLHLDRTLNHIIFITFESSTLHLDLFFAILTGKLYTLGILRTLNSRTQFRAGLHTSHLGRRSLTAWDWGAAERAAWLEWRCLSQLTAAARPSWAGSGIDPRDSAGGPGAAPVPWSRSGSAGEDGAFRSSDETMRSSMSMSISSDRLSLQTIPSVHYTPPKAGKSFSRGSYAHPEHAGAWPRPP